MVNTIQLPLKSKYGAAIEIVPVTSDDVFNKKTCFWLNGSAEEPIEFQQVFPYGVLELLVNENSNITDSTEFMVFKWNFDLIIFFLIFIIYSLLGKPSGEILLQMYINIKRIQMIIRKTHTHFILIH